MIYLNIGSNLSSVYGNRFKNIEKCLNLLISKDIKLTKISSFYETPSYPNPRHPKFINVSLKVKTTLSPTLFLNKIKLIEKKIGRLKTKKNEPRVCDIDIIDFKGLIINKNKLQIPHSKLHVRNFVLYPLREIEPNWTHPVFNKKIDYFLKRLNLKSHIEITRLKKSVIL
tara:strand:- start:3997 stop:4506 length:510 start_codon:yes stop_codon:yes gene_type:complete